MSDASELRASMVTVARAARAAARPLARADAATRTQSLHAIAELLRAGCEEIEQANHQDLRRAEERALSKAMLDRLALSGDRVETLADAITQIAGLDDPVGSVARGWTRPNGLEVQKVRLPLGVILMIYESRPNVTVDAAALCIRSGNAAILRGGSEAAATNAVLARLVQAALTQTGLPAAAVQHVPTQDRAAIDELLQLDELIDLVVPRGGEKLIRRVAQTSRIPVVQHYKGVCHLFVEASADLEQALDIVENAKVQRPGVCNALETLLVDAAVATSFLPRLVQRLAPQGVELRGCAQARSIAPELTRATEQDWDTEYLDLILAIRVVDGLGEAIAHIDAHGTQHTASICTREDAAADRFCRDVDASCVMVNASTRFNDGGELGLGAEMGISTTRVHAYGPMGVESLTAEKFVVRGHGQIRP